MATGSIQSRVGWLGALVLALALPVCASDWLTLEQAASRQAPDFSPVHNLEDVTVSGIVSLPCIRILTYAHMGIHDGAGHGLVLDGPLETFGSFHPGDIVDASGSIGLRGGLVVLFVREIKRTGHTEPSLPIKVRWHDLNSTKYLGLFVSTEGKVTEVGENTGGDYLLIGDTTAVKVFLPRSSRFSEKGLPELRPGDTVAVTGLSSQYCPIAPYNRMFQILAPNAGAVRLVSRGWLVSPFAIAAAGTLLGLALLVWWGRERRMSAQRLATRTLNSLGEDVLSANSAAEILEKLRAVVPELIKVSDVHLYVYRPGLKALERIPGPNVEAAIIQVDSPEGPVASAAALCFRNKTLLVFTDTWRSSLFRGAALNGAPRSIMFVPMFAQTDVLGVLALSHAGKARSFNQDEQAAAQHFANQIATSLRFLEQRTVREQLFRSEKLAAAGQLISGLVDELQAPLESVSMMASRALARPADQETKRQLAAIASEARRASDIVSRLLSFARAEKSEAKPVDVNALLASLIKFRKRECEARGIQLSDRLSTEPIHVLGSMGQLEQVFLNLMIHAEQSLANSDQRGVCISTGLLARRVLVGISYSSAASGVHRDPFVDPGMQDGGTLGLGVCRGIIQSHSGEIRFVRTGLAECRFEVELPVAYTGVAAAIGGEDRASRNWTVLTVEPDPAVQRQLLVHLSARGCRVVPVAAPEEAARMARRMKFDLVFCSVRVSGMNWLEFFETVRGLVGAFVLMTEGYDSDLASAFQSSDAFILGKPVDEKELDRLLEVVGESAGQSR